MFKLATDFWGLTEVRVSCIVFGLLLSELQLLWRHVFPTGISVQFEEGSVEWQFSNAQMVPAA